MSTFNEHIDIMVHRHAVAAQRAKVEGFAVYSGDPHIRFRDDRDYPFMVNPHYSVLAPFSIAPHCWVIMQAGRRPKLVYLQPEDYWHCVPEAPSGAWVDQYDIEIVSTQDEAQDILPNDRSKWAFIGEETSLAEKLKFGGINPEPAMIYLEYHRGCKTAFEVDQVLEANRIGARAHLAAERAFREGRSEFDILLEFQRATRQSETQLPYSPIIALNENGAVLHYHDCKLSAPAELRSFLIDAGADYRGYASDITRTYSAKGDEFADMVEAMDEVQRTLCDGVVPGRGYAELHLDAHRRIAGVLKDFSIITCSADAAAENGLSSAFFPHGLGHPIGAQVHDAGGFYRTDEGHPEPPPEAHPFLRTTRTLDEGMIVTIEPGLYFIDLLLGPLKDTDRGKDVNWSRVDTFRPFGGIRIEDNVVATSNGARNLTREAFRSEV